jgi:hypothetical protein
MPDHDAVMTAEVAIAVKTVGAMPIAMPAMVPAVIAMLDHDGFGTRNRRRRYRNRAKRCDNISKLPHVSPPPVKRGLNPQAEGTFRGNCGRILNSRSASCIYPDLSAFAIAKRYSVIA